MSEVIGSISVVASINTTDYDNAKKHIEQGNNQLESGAQKTSKGFSSVWTGAIIGVAAALTTKFLGAITSSIGGAIKRVDTLKNANRTFENMGFKSEESAKSIKTLNKSILGLPTPLDSAIRGMTSLASTYGDVDKGQKVFTALNNAILGFGGTAEMVDNAIQQVSQLPMDGPLDAQTWNSLRNSGLTPVLVAMAKESGTSVSAMKKAFGSGELKVQDFTDRLIKMNTDGGGGLKSLEKIAKDSTSGIGTGMANLQTSITRGIADIIEAVGSENISAFISELGKAFTVALVGVSAFILFVKDNGDVFSAIAVGIAAAGTAILLYTGYVKAAALFTAAYTAVSSFLTLTMSLQAQGLGVARAAWMALNIVMKANPMGIIITALIAITAALTYFFTKTKLGKKIFGDFLAFVSGVWDKIYGAIQVVADYLSTAFDVAVTAVKDAINTIKQTFSDVFDAVKGFIEEHKTAIINWSIVIGTILLPKIVAIGTQAAITAAKTVASFVTMSAGAVKEAVVSSAAWVASSAASALAWLKALPKVIAQFVATSASAVLNALKVSASFIASSVSTLAGWAITFVAMVAGFVLMGAQALIAAGKVALSWLLAMGPIGLIIALVIGLVALIIANWDTVKAMFSAFWGWLKNIASTVWTAITGFFSGAWDNIKKVWGKVKEWFGNVWNGIKSIFSKVVSFYAGVFSGAWNAVKRVFSAVGGFFRGVWGTIKSIFGKIGSSVGNAIGGAFKSAINGVLRFAVGMINKFIDGINGAISIINKIPKVNIPTVGKLGVPQLAKGGIVSSPTLAMIGEGRESEAVIPLSKLDAMLNNRNGVGEASYNIQNINISKEVDGERWIRKLTGRQEVVSNGLVPTQEYGA